MVFVDLYLVIGLLFAEFMMWQYTVNPKAEKIISKLGDIRIVYFVFVILWCYILVSGIYENITEKKK